MQVRQEQEGETGRESGIGNPESSFGKTKKMRESLPASFSYIPSSYSMTAARLAACTSKGSGELPLPS